MKIVMVRIYIASIFFICVIMINGDINIFLGNLEIIKNKQAIIGCQSLQTENIVIFENNKSQPIRKAGNQVQCQKYTKFLPI